MIKVSMAAEADTVIVPDRCLKVFRIPDIYFVSMWIMAFPARKTIFLQLEMSTLLILCLYFVKMELCESLISPMAVDTVIFFLHPELARMRKVFIIIGMTICTAETFMI